MTHLRSTRASLSSNSNAIHDVVNFLSALPALKKRQHNNHLFPLSCLCPTDRAPSLPTVSFGSISTSILSCRSNDVMSPAQSFFSKLPQAVPICTSYSASENFSTLCFDFGETGMDPSYNQDPWRSIDYFESGKFHKKLSVSYKRLLESRDSPRQKSSVH